MIENLLFAGVLAAVVLYFVHSARKKGAGAARGAPDSGVSAKEKGEALFVSMFPELQPHFHPEKLVAYVAARRGRTPARGGSTWKAAPGFAVPAVEIRFAGEREECSLLDAAGAVLARFRFEAHADGGVLRVGAGKLTVDLRSVHDPAVRYWHPDREFKWTRRGGWRFKTPVAESPFDSPSRDTGGSDSSSSSDTARTAATVAAFAGLGGTFDGGGASAGWDGAAAPEAAADEPSAAAAGDAGSASGSSGESGGDSGGDSGSDSGGDSGSDSGGDSGSDSGGDSGSDSGDTSY